jgi:hypothetical protein
VPLDSFFSGFNAHVKSRLILITNGNFNSYRLPKFCGDSTCASLCGRIVHWCYIGVGHKVSSRPFAIMGFEQPAEGQICVPETPSQNPADKGKNRQGIENERNHKFLSVHTLRPPSGRKRRDSPATTRTIAQAARAAETGLPLVRNMLKH